MTNDSRPIVPTLKLYYFFAAVFLSSLSVAQTNLNVAKEITNAAKQYKGMLASHTDITKFPQSILPNGQAKDMPADWWCSGFFGGSLWYLYEYTKDTTWKNAANKWSMAVEKEKDNKGTHDLGFMLYCPFGNGYRLTQNNDYKQIMLTGAASLATRFNPKYGVIKSWDDWKGYDYPVIIDNMMNLEFLLWAAKASGNKKYYDICISHADHTLKNHFRKDYSSYHVVCYGEDAKVLAQKTHQGYADSSAWARGQGWALYGYTVMYRATKQPKYLAQAEHVAHFILTHPNLPTDKIPYWDFNAPNIPNEERDASAAAVIASGLLELSQYSKANRKQYFDAATAMLTSLASNKYTAKIGSNKNFILMHSVGSKPAGSEIDTPLVYADYYYLEAFASLRQIDETRTTKISLMKDKKLAHTYLIISILLMAACGSSKKQATQTSATEKTIDKGKLVFQTGFEGDCKVIVNSNDVPGGITQHYEIDDIVGADNTLSTKNDFVKDLDESPDGGKFMLEYTGGDSTKRKARIIQEPNNPNNKVLQFWLNDSWEASEHQVKARIQADIYGIKPGYKAFYQSVKMYLTPDFNALKSYPEKINWLTIAEFWNNEWWVETEKYGFRVTLGIGKPAGEKSGLNFILNAENAGQKEVWNANTPEAQKVKVPIGKWFTMEYYYKEGNAQTGRFYMAITPDGGKKQVVFDVTNFTQNTTDPSPNGVTGFSPMKLYTSKDVVGFVKAQGKTLQIYWDDFKLWKGK